MLEVLGVSPKSLAGGRFYCPPLHPSGHFNISWPPQWLVTDKYVSRPRAIGLVPQEKSEFKESEPSAPTPSPSSHPRWVS